MLATIEGAAPWIISIGVLGILFLFVLSLTRAAREGSRMTELDERRLQVARGKAQLPYAVTACPVCGGSSNLRDVWAHVLDDHPDSHHAHILREVLSERKGE